MKKLYLLPLIFLVIFSNCQKNEPIPYPTTTLVSDLINKQWSLQNRTRSGVQNIPPQGNLVKYILFNSDSTFIGHTGCNGIEGIYHANDSGSIFFLSVLNANAAPCPPNTGEWHDIITDQLLACHSFKITDNRLQLDASLNDTTDVLNFSK